MEMGADVVKLNMPKINAEKDKDAPAPYNEMEVDQAEAIRQCVESAGRSLVVLSGGSKVDDETVLTHTREIMEAGGSRRDLRPQRLAARVERGAGDHRPDQGDAALQRAPHPVAAPGGRALSARLLMRGWDIGTACGAASSAASCCSSWSLRLILRPWEARPERGAGHARGPASIRAVDGDTIEVRIGGRLEDVRYIGVDTPGDGQARTRRCSASGRSASAFDHRLVEQRRVRLVFGVERRDIYGRLLAYVYLGPSLRQRDPGPPRPRPHADDPAQRPLRAAVPAPGAARGAGRARALGRLLSVPVVTHRTLQAPASARAPLLRSPAAPGATHLCECVRASPSSRSPSSRRHHLSAAGASSCAAAPPTARARAGSPAPSRQGKVRFSVLAVCLTVTVVVVVVVDVRGARLPDGLAAAAYDRPG